MHSKPLGWLLAAILLLVGWAPVVPANVAELTLIVENLVTALEEDPDYRLLTPNQRQEALRAMLALEFSASTEPSVARRLERYLRGTPIDPAMPANQIAAVVQRGAANQGVRTALEQAVSRSYRTFPEAGQGSRRAPVPAARRRQRGQGLTKTAVARARLEQGVVAQLVEVQGDVQVGAESLGIPLRPARVGTELGIEHTVKTGPGARCRLVFMDVDEETGSGPSVANIGPSSEVRIHDFQVSFDMPKKRVGLIELVKGAVRAFTSGWKSNSIFSVQAGTTLCGIRGSAADITFEPGPDGSMVAQVVTLSGEVIPITIPASALQGGDTMLTINLSVATASGPVNVGSITIRPDPLAPGMMTVTTQTRLTDGSIRTSNPVQVVAPPGGLNSNLGSATGVTVDYVAGSEGAGAIGDLLADDDGVQDTTSGGDDTSSDDTSSDDSTMDDTTTGGTVGTESVIETIIQDQQQDDSYSEPVSEQ